MVTHESTESISRTSHRLLLQHENTEVDTNFLFYLKNISNGAITDVTANFLEGIFFFSFQFAVLSITAFGNQHLTKCKKNLYQALH